MPIDKFVSEVLNVISQNRNPDSYIAGATVLHQSKDSIRYSKDIDVFHDNIDSVTDSFEKDLITLSQNGYEVEVTKQLKTFIRAIVRKKNSGVRLEWAIDSAFRFFPIEKDPELGFKLNFWDVATNKVLAACSRVEVRDYIDLIELHTKKIKLCSLIWAAAGKDAGLTPSFIVEELKRIHHHSEQAMSSLDIDVSPDSKSLHKIWTTALNEAVDFFASIPPQIPLGVFFLDKNNVPQTPTLDTFSTFKLHKGCIRGAWPQVI